MWLRTTRKRLILRRPQIGNSAMKLVQSAPAVPGVRPKTLYPVPGVIVEQAYSDQIKEVKYFHSGAPCSIVDSLVEHVPQFKNAVDDAVSAIAHGAVRVRGTPLPSDAAMVFQGERVEVVTGLPHVADTAFDPSWVLSEDGVVMILNKPAGLFTAPPHFSRSVDIASLASRDLGMPLVVSLERARLDAVASGVTLLVTAASALPAARAAYQANAFLRSYIAACSGRWPFNDAATIIDLPVSTWGPEQSAVVKVYSNDAGTDPLFSDSYRKVASPNLQDKSPESALPSPAATAVRFVAYDAARNITLVEAVSISETATGQIRAHLAAVGLPVIGDVGNGAPSLDAAVAAEAGRVALKATGTAEAPQGAATGTTSSTTSGTTSALAATRTPPAPTARSSRWTASAVALHASYAAWPAIPGSPRTSAMAPPPTWWSSILPPSILERAHRAAAAPPRILQMKALLEYEPMSPADHHAAAAVGRPARRTAPSVVTTKSPRAAHQSREHEKVKDAKMMQATYRPPSHYRGVV